jgi:adenylate kinase family enzyme
MPADDNPRVQIRQFLDCQSRERYRAFVIHGPPLSGKTAFAQKLARVIPGTVYLDMLHYVNERPELAQQVDCIDATRLQGLVVDHAILMQTRFLLVDHIDFLVHSWDDDLATFKYCVRSLAVTRTQAVVGFVLQTQRALVEWNLPNRILSIEEIEAL